MILPQFMIHILEALDLQKNQMMNQKWIAETMNEKLTGPVHSFFIKPVKQNFITIVPKGTKSPDPMWGFGPTMTY
jgi:hypothetical protein